MSAYCSYSKNLRGSVVERWARYIMLPGSARVGTVIFLRSSAASSSCPGWMIYTTVKQIICVSSRLGLYHTPLALPRETAPFWILDLPPTPNPKSKIQNPSGPWERFLRITTGADRKETRMNDEKDYQRPEGDFSVASSSM